MFGLWVVEVEPKDTEGGLCALHLALCSVTSTSSAAGPVLDTESKKLDHHPESKTPPTVQPLRLTPMGPCHRTGEDRGCFDSFLWHDLLGGGLISSPFVRGGHSPEQLGRWGEVTLPSEPGSGRVESKRWM